MRAQSSRWFLLWVLCTGLVAIGVGCMAPADTPLLPPEDGGTFDAGGVAILSSDASSKDFGSVVLDDASAAAAITIANTGTGPTGALASQIGGDAAAAFAIDKDDCAGKALDAGARCVIAVRFKPSGSAGAKKATLTVLGSPGGSAQVALSGNALTPGSLAFSPASHDFGGVALNGSSPLVAFTLTNGGGGATGPIAVNVGGSDKASFVVQNDGCTGIGLAPGGTCTVQVKLAPDSLGAKSASLSATASPGGGTSVALTGAGVIPGALAISPGSNDFGSVVIGQTSAEAAFTITNTGQSSTGPMSIALAGADASSFVLTSNGCSGALAGGASCTLHVKLAPTSAGAKSATIGATASPGGTATATITGRGLVAAALSIAPASDDFGSVVIGSSSADATFTVTNTGGTDSGVPSVATGGANASEFVVVGGTCNAALPAGGTCTVLAHFKPSASGARAGSISVSATPGGTATATVSGTGLVPGSIAIAPPSQDFGSLVVGNVSSDVTFTVSNGGGAATGAPSISLTGADASQFAIASNGCSGPIVAGSSCKVTVHFLPSSSGAKAASLSVTAAPGGSASAALSGVGLGPAALSIVPATQDFGTIVAGATTADTTFTVKNTGGVAAGTPSPSLSGANGAEFAIASSTCTGPLVAGATCTVKVHFAPATAGSKSASLSVASSPGGSAQAALTGNALAPAQLTVSPNAAPFGTIVLGSSSADTPFTVQNTGAVASGVPTVSITGTDATEFAIGTNGCTAALASGGQCTFTVHMTPTSAGTKSATVSITASPGGTASAALSGTAVTPGALSISPGNQPYGSIVTGGKSTDATFTVTNTGGASTGSLTAQLSGANAGDFVLDTNNCSAALAPNATCTIFVAFAPSTTGPKSASLSVSGTPGGTAAASLSGTAIAPAQLSFSPTSNDFGSIVTGAASSNVSFTLTNVGGAATGVPTIGKSGADAPDFVIVSSTCTASLGPSQSCLVTVSFQPTTTGGKSAQLNASASPGGSAQSTMTGTAIAPALLAMTPASNDFLTVVDGTQSADVPFTVTNNGGAPTGALTVAIGGANAGEFAIGSSSTCGASLAAASSCTVYVHFAPTTPGAKSASLDVSASPGGNASATLDGTGVAPASIGATPTTWDYNTVVIGSTGTRTFTLTNNGGATSGAPNVSLSGTDAGDFAITNNACTAALAGGGSCTFDVVFSPATAGLKNAQIDVTVSPGGPVSPVPIKGFAATPGALVSLTTATAFGPTTVGQTSATQTFQFQNQGGSATGTLTTQLGGANGAEFQITADSCNGAQLAANAICAITIDMQPGTSGSKAATLSVTGSPGGTAGVTLSGNAVDAAQLTIAPPGGNDYGSIGVFGQSNDVVFTITNSGGSTSGAVTAAVSGANADQFTVTGNTCGAALAPNGTCTITVRFTPTNVASAAASVGASASPGGTASAPLSGVGAADGGF